MTDDVLDPLGPNGGVIVDGPLARDALCLQVLAELQPADRLRHADVRSCAAGAAAKLANGSHALADHPEVVQPAALSNLDNDRPRWRRKNSPWPLEGYGLRPRLGLALFIGRLRARGEASILPR
jgi:sugar (pentulose or hexulose) kinase